MMSVRREERGGPWKGCSYGKRCEHKAPLGARGHRVRVRTGGRSAPAAYAFWYVHSDEHVADSGGKGVYEIACTLDASAVGEGVTTGVIFVPEGSTAADCPSMRWSCRAIAKNGLDAIHNYDTQAVADALAGRDAHDYRVPRRRPEARHAHHARCRWHHGREHRP